MTGAVRQRKLIHFLRGKRGLWQVDDIADLDAKAAVAQEQFMTVILRGKHLVAGQWRTSDLSFTSKSARALPTSFHSAPLPLRIRRSRRHNRLSGVMGIGHGKCAPI